MKTTIAILLATITLAYADPAERAQILKGKIIEQMVQDGWQPVQDNALIVTLEKPVNGISGFMAQAFMTGANGTAPVYRVTISIIPKTNHWTLCPYWLSVSSQNGFGQTTAIRVTNKKAIAYILNMMTNAAATMPVKYKSNRLATK